MTTVDARIKRRLADLYHLSPVLWAVVRGDYHEAAIAERLGKPPAGIARAVREAMAAGILTLDGRRIVPNLPKHRSLYNELHPELASPSLKRHPILDLLIPGSMSTKDIANAMGRTYQSTYKTLQRLQHACLVTRDNKLWCLVT